MGNKQTRPRGAGGLEQGKEGDWAWGSRQNGAKGAAGPSQGKQGIWAGEVGGLDHREQGMGWGELGLGQWEQDYWAMSRRWIGPGRAGRLGQGKQGLGRRSRD
jgi:hypothetical protein